MRWQTDVFWLAFIAFVSSIAEGGDVRSFVIVPEKWFAASSSGSEKSPHREDFVCHAEGWEVALTLDVARVLSNLWKYIDGGMPAANGCGTERVPPRAVSEYCSEH